MEKEKISFDIRQKAMDLGFYSVGFAKAEYMEKEARNLEHWLSQSYHGEMSYMENHFDKRVDPTKLVPGAKSVISLMYNYYTDEKQEDSYAPKIASYAYGKDYHKVIKKKLKELLFYIMESYGDVAARIFVDSAPVLEREWAERAGLGWKGKHTLLLSKDKGSFFFLAEIVLDLDLVYDHKLKDHCGTCTRCIDACPTDAIKPEGYILDASKCISYLTIELKNAIPDEFAGKMKNWMFGCDICQEVCPWNRFSSMHKEKKFLPKAELMNMKKEEWEEITEEIFNNLFQGSAVKRTKFSGLKRNIDFLK